jgi:magnesium transporter
MAKRKRKKTGLPPGSIVFTGNRKVEKILLHFLQYDSVYLEEKELDNHSHIPLQKSFEDKVDWYDIRGIHDTKLIEFVGKTFDIHPLILEDIADTHQRPKFEEYDNGVFTVIQSLSYNRETMNIQREQVAIFFRKGFIVTFQEREKDLFESIRQRLRKSNGKIRHRGADYLAYAIMDTVVDHYYEVLEDVEETIESLEEQIMNSQDTTVKGVIHRLKYELLTFRKSIAPLRESVNKFSKSDSPYIEEESMLFVRDLYDHTIQVLEMTDSLRDILISLQELLLSEVSFKMNQVMQLLTLIATIFIPLTFLAGIYGMNFKNMPELQTENGYFVLLAIMLIIFVGLLYYFKRKKWI